MPKKTFYVPPSNASNGAPRDSATPTGTSDSPFLVRKGSGKTALKHSEISKYAKEKGK